MDETSQPSTSIPQDITAALEGLLAQASPMESDNRSEVRLLGELLRDGSAEEDDLARALSVLGRLVYGVHGVRGEDEEAFAAVVAWQERVNQWVKETGRAVRVRLIHPGERYDMECMESVRTATGHRLQVERALSWVVLRRNPDAEPTVLQRAQVVTR